MKKFHLKLNKLCSNFEEELQNIGKEIRQEIIIPICYKYKLEFTCGNGVFFFTSNKFEVGKNTYFEDLYDLEVITNDRLKTKLISCFNLLNYEISYNNVIGYYVSDVNKKDY